MDLGRFHYAINIIDTEIETLQISTHLDKLIQDLNNIASNPGNSDVSKTFKDHVNELREILLKSELSNPSDEEVAQVVFDLDLVEFVGQRLLERILETFQSNQLSATLASTELATLKQAVLKKLSQVQALNNSFTELGVEYFNFEDGDGEMLIDLPVEMETKTLEDLSKEAKEWHRICDAVCETFDPTRTPVTIRTLASGSWLLYLAGTPAFIYGIAKCMKGVNSILAELIKARSLYSELVANRTPKEILKKLDQHNATKVKTDLDELATSLVKEFYKGGDDGRQNELRNALSLALQRLSRKLADGSRVQLRLVMPKEPVIEEGQEPTAEQAEQRRAVEEAKKIRLEIEQAKPQLDFDEHQAELQKALPAPTLEQGPEERTLKGSN